MLGCARPDASPPLDQPPTVKIGSEGNSCDPTYDDGTKTCNDTVKEARYRITIDENGWITKVNIFTIIRTPVILNLLTSHVFACVVYRAVLSNED